MIENPFIEKNLTDTKDEELIDAALKGSRQSLEQIIYRHQAWIYNIALRMVFLRSSPNFLPLEKKAASGHGFTG